MRKIAYRGIVLVNIINRCIHGGNHPIRIDLPRISTATLESYTCISCRYTELYVDRMGNENIKKVGQFVSNAPQAPYPFQSEPKCPIYGASISSKSAFCLQCGSEIN